MPFIAAEIVSFPDVIPALRFATYLQAKHGRVEEDLALYAWNAEVSAAIMTPLHLVEIAIRNAAADPIKIVHQTKLALGERLHPQPAAPTCGKPLKSQQNLRNVANARFAGPFRHAALP